MAEKMFHVSQGDLVKFQSFLKKAPSRFAKATGSTINDFAFGTMNTSSEVIREKMNVRAPGFLTSHLRVAKSNRRLPMSGQKSEAGSLSGPRFTGWREQQTGEKTARQRVINLNARIGQSMRRRVRGKNRIRAGSDFQRFRNFQGGSPNQRSTKMLQALDRKRWKEPFYLTRKRGVQPGVWIFRRRKLTPLHLFKVSQPRRIRWLSIAVERYFQRQPIERTWASNAKFALKIRKK